MPAGGGARVEGARELESTAHRAADELGDLTAPHGRAGDYVAGIARTLAPRLTGRLAGTIRADARPMEATVTAGGPGVPYAGVIHNGWAGHNISATPFLTDALTQGEGSVVGFFADENSRIVSQIHGA